MLFAERKHAHTPKFSECNQFMWKSFWIASATAKRFDNPGPEKLVGLFVGRIQFPNFTVGIVVTFRRCVCLGSRRQTKFVFDHSRALERCGGFLDAPDGAIDGGQVFRANRTRNDVRSEGRDLVIADGHMNEQFVGWRIGQHVFPHIGRITTGLRTIPKHLHEALDELDIASFAVCAAHEREKRPEMGAAIEEHRIGHAGNADEAACDVGRNGHVGRAGKCPLGYRRDKTSALDR